jgi:hypothetical protein
MAKVFFCEVPDHVWDALNSYIEARPGRNLDGTVTGALALFLLQNQTFDENSGSLSRTYLDSMFKREAG